MESTHGTPPAAGIASFRSATTKHNIPSKAKAVKWIFSGIGSLCVLICSYSVCIKIFIPILNRLLRLLPPCIQIIQIPIGSLHIIIIHPHSISNNTLSTKQVHLRRFRLSFHHINNTPAQLTDTIIQSGILQMLQHQCFILLQYNLRIVYIFCQQQHIDKVHHLLQRIMGFG